MVETNCYELLSNFRLTSVIDNMPEILIKSRIIDKQTNRKGGWYDSYTVSAPITINGERFVAFAIVNEAAKQVNL